MNSLQDYIAETWSPRGLVIRERLLWVAVMEAQRDMGLDIPDDVIEDYAMVSHSVDLLSIKERERVLRHDLKARLEEFNELAGHERAHLGMTSHDVVDCVMQRRVSESMRILAQYVPKWADILLTHHYPLRGIVGPVGTMQDQIDLLGSVHAAEYVNAKVAQRLGFASVVGSIGQIYPRSLDLGWATLLMRVVADLAPGAIELKVMSGYLSMIADAAVDQWAEGDVSYSASRRVAIPGMWAAVAAALAPPGPPAAPPANA